MKHILFLQVVMFTVFQVNAQTKFSTLSRFKYNPALIEEGTVYHYIKSNLDGSKPSHVSVYIKHRDSLEVCKIEKGLIDAALIVANMDWPTFSPNSMDAYVYDRDTTIHRANFQLAEDKKSFTIKYPKGKEEQYIIPYQPVHIYNFDMVSINYIFRHLKNPTKPFDIPIFDPTYSKDTAANTFEYKGPLHFEYIRDEYLHRQKCRKYKISGKGIGGKTGYVWVNKSKGHFENIEVPWPDNPNWNSFKFELKKTEKMTHEEWKNFRLKPFMKQ